MHHTNGERRRQKETGVLLGTVLYDTLFEKIIVEKCVIENRPQ